MTDRKGRVSTNKAEAERDDALDIIQTILRSRKKTSEAYKGEPPYDPDKVSDALVDEVLAEEKAQNLLRKLGRDVP